MTTLPSSPAGERDDVARALCATCGAERTVRWGGARNYRPRGYDYDSKAAQLKCATCGKIAPHAVVPPLTAHERTRSALIKAYADAEDAGITIKRIRFDYERDAEVRQHLNIANFWEIWIDERLSIEDQLVSLVLARSYIDRASGTRWYFRPETAKTFPMRWIHLTVDANGTPRWRKNDPATPLVVI